MVQLIMSFKYKKPAIIIIASIIIIPTIIWLASVTLVFIFFFSGIKPRGAEQIGESKYWKTDKAVYYNSGFMGDADFFDKIKGISPDTIRTFPNQCCIALSGSNLILGSNIAVDFDTGKLIFVGDNYIKDDKQIIRLLTPYEKFTSADAKTFEYRDGFYRDKNYVYTLLQKIIPDADPATMVLLGCGFVLSKDKNHVYKDMEKVPEIDAQTLMQTGPPHRKWETCSDKFGPVTDERLKDYKE